MNRGDLADRFDAISKQPVLLARLAALSSAPYPIQTLGTLVTSVRYGTGSPPAYLPQGPETTPFVRATDIKNGEVVIETLKYISGNQPKAMQKCRLEGGELIVVRSGVNTGDCAVVPANLRGAFAAYDLILKLPAAEDAKFVAEFLDTSVGRLQLNLIRGRAAQPHVNAEELSAIRLPFPQDPKVRGNLVAVIDAARDERRAKLSRAESLLAGMSDFVVALLRLKPPVTLPNHPYAVTTGEARRDGKLSSDYFSPERVLALRMLKEAKGVTVGSVASFVNFIRCQIKQPEANYIGLANVQPHTGELVEAAEEVSGACSTFEADDVLFARLRPYLNKVYRAEESGCCSPEFHVMRVKDRAVLLPDYLAVVLRTRFVLAQTVHMMTGNTHPRLANEDVVALQIPVPDVGIQSAVVAEAARRRAEARRLRIEAEDTWQTAKRWFEAQLLGASAE